MAQDEERERGRAVRQIVGPEDGPARVEGGTAAAPVTDAALMYLFVQLTGRGCDALASDGRAALLRLLQALRACGSSADREGLIDALAQAMERPELLRAWVEAGCPGPAMPAMPATMPSVGSVMPSAGAVPFAIAPSMDGSSCETPPAHKALAAASNTAQKDAVERGQYALEHRDDDTVVIDRATGFERRPATLAAGKVLPGDPSGSVFLSARDMERAGIHGIADAIAFLRDLVGGRLVYGRYRHSRRAAATYEDARQYGLATRADILTRCRGGDAASVSLWHDPDEDAPFLVQQLDRRRIPHLDWLRRPIPADALECPLAVKVAAGTMPSHPLSQTEGDPGYIPSVMLYNALRNNGVVHTLDLALLIIAYGASSFWFSRPRGPLRVSRMYAAGMRRVVRCLEEM